MMRRFQQIIVMGFIATLSGCNKPSDNSPSGPKEDPKAEEQPMFISEADYVQNRAKQIAMTPQTLDKLRGHDVTDESELKLKYFFYTNDKKKAKSLVKELAKLGYEGGHDIAAEAPDQFLITGWTIPMRMSNESVVGWTGRMCDLGHKSDCEFDGWGANPNP